MTPLVCALQWLLGRRKAPRSRRQNTPKQHPRICCPCAHYRSSSVKFSELFSWFLRQILWEMRREFCGISEPKTHKQSPRQFGTDSERLGMTINATQKKSCQLCSADVCDGTPPLQHVGRYVQTRDVARNRRNHAILAQMTSLRGACNVGNFRSFPG